MQILDYLQSLPEELVKELSDQCVKYGKDYLNARGDKKKLTKLVKKIYKVLDENIAESIIDISVSCKSKCSYCCHTYVKITEDEAQVIKNHCKHYNIPINLDVIKKQSNYCFENWPIDKDLSKCVFLNDIGECSIYSMRPMSCRKYYVKSKPELCDTSTGKHKVQILFNIEAELFVAGIFNVCNIDSIPRQLLKYF